MLMFSNPGFYFQMKHLENEFSQNHSLKRLSCSAASGNNLNNVIGIETIKIYNVNF